MPLGVMVSATVAIAAVWYGLSARLVSCFKTLYGSKIPQLNRHVSANRLPLAGSETFIRRPCGDFEDYLLSEVVGQPLALHQFCDAVCDHLAKEEPVKPLVVSFHGPPGVGKSLLHSIATRMLYNQKPTSALKCPGSDCAGYKVMYGMDYMAAEREHQHLLLREALLSHIRRFSQSLIVIEEYDKIDCHTRGMFRQLIENPQTANVSLGRSIVLMESNTGYPQLHKMVEEAKAKRAQVSAEAAEHMLKDLVFEMWRGNECESHADTLKTIRLVDFYLPFMPLQREDIRKLFHMRLRDRALRAQADGLPGFTWTAAVVEFLMSKVDFDGDYPVEGAKEVATLMTRYVTRVLRPWEQHVRRRATPESLTQSWYSQLKHVSAGKLGKPRRICEDCGDGVLQVAKGDGSLVVVSDSGARHDEMR